MLIVILFNFFGNVFIFCIIYLKLSKQIADFVDVVIVLFRPCFIATVRDELRSKISSVTAENYHIEFSTM